MVQIRSSRAGVPGSSTARLFQVPVCVIPCVLMATAKPTPTPTHTPQLSRPSTMPMRVCMSSDTDTPRHPHKDEGEEE